MIALINLEVFCPIHRVVVLSCSEIRDEKDPNFLSSQGLMNIKLQSLRTHKRTERLVLAITQEDWT